MDIELSYTEKGAGFPLILIHGNGGSREDFSEQIGVFAGKYHVYAPDTRGHGKSPRGEKTFTLSRFADDLFCFMNAHGIEKAHIVGFSDGGNIALLFALKYPGKLARLVVDGANIFPAGLDEESEKFIKKRYLELRELAKNDPSYIPKKEMYSLMANQPRIKPEKLSAINAPTLVMAGTRDVIRKEHTELIAASIPGSKLVFIEGDHFIAKKNSAEFNRAVLEFLDQN